jgi:hypothetical protein
MSVIFRVRRGMILIPRTLYFNFQGRYRGKSLYRRQVGSELESINTQYILVLISQSSLSEQVKG